MFLLQSHCPQLESVDAALLRQLVLQELVDHAMARRLHLGLESVGRDDEPEVRLLRRAADHGLMVRVLVRVIEDLEARRLKSVGQLCCSQYKWVSGETSRKGLAVHVTRNGSLKYLGRLHV